MSGRKTCFVISPIGSEDSEARQRSDKVFEHVIQDAVEDKGYEALRADQIDEPGQITTQVIQKAVNSELVIADLTDENPNVFYELAIRHATREPFIQIIEQGGDIPFDIRDQRTITLDINDLDSVADAQDEIQAQIESIEAGEIEVDSPISTAMELQFWEESGDPQQQELAEVIEMMTELQSEVGKIRNEVSTAKPQSKIELSHSRQEQLERIEHRAMEMQMAISDIERIALDKGSLNSQNKEKVREAVDYIEDSTRSIESLVRDIVHAKE